MERILISVREMAEQFGISLTVAYRLSREDGFPTVRLGRRRLVDVEGLRAWLDAQRENPVGDA